MKCQILFSEKVKKHISLSSAECAQSLLSVEPNNVSVISRCDMCLYV